MTFAGGSPSSSGYLMVLWRASAGSLVATGNPQGGLREKMEPGSAWGTQQRHEVQREHVAASKIPLSIRKKHPWGGQNHSPQGMEIPLLGNTWNSIGYDSTSNFEVGFALSQGLGKNGLQRALPNWITPGFNILAREFPTQNYFISALIRFLYFSSALQSLPTLFSLSSPKWYLFVPRLQLKQAWLYRKQEIALLFFTWIWKLRGVGSIQGTVL